MNIPLPCPPAIPTAALERLEREFATYRRELPRLLATGHAGRFALIHEDQILSIWDTQQAASQEGRQRFGLDPITVEKIDPRDVERLALLDARTEATCRS
jgi:hypothetical protein